MNASIKNIYNYHSGRGRPRAQKARVFPKSNATDLADEWFSKNGVYSLEFKSKTWQKIGRLINKINRPVIANLLESDLKNVQFSAYCGCSCPCSPGYNVFSPRDKFKGMGVSVNIEASEGELEPLTNYINNFADLELQVEIAEHTNK